MFNWKLRVQGLWIMLRRSGKDLRARGKLSGMIVPFIPTILIVAAMPSGYRVILGIALVFILAGGIVAGSFIGRDPRPKFADPQVAADVCAFLKDRSLILTSLFVRGTAELYVQQFPEKLNLAEQTRQIQNQFLRRENVWERMEPAERELASAAIGTWPPERNGTAHWAEQVRLLRWTLRVDEHLAPLSFFQPYDVAQVQDTRTVSRATNTRPPWDIRVVRDEAAFYLGRILMEQKSRGMIPADADIGNFPESIRGESKDLLVGAKTVGALTKDELLAFSAMAFARWQYAGYLVEQVSAEKPLPLV